MNFEWDDNKKRTNDEKHGVSFEDAPIVFSGEVVTFVDDRQPYGEERFISLGALQGRVIVIVHTRRNQVMRIISMRKANAKEQKIYQERLRENR
jgi:hypothetical protein